MTDHLFAVDEDTRTARGILLPYNEQSRVSVSGAEPIMFAPGTVTLPADPSVVTLNREHNRFDPIGRATVLEERPEGIYAEFKIARTPEGDDYLTNGGKMRKLSAEVADIVRRGVEAVKSRLTGAAVVPEGAFAGAHLFAIGDIEDAPAPEDGPAAEHLHIDAPALPEDITVTTPEGETATYTPEAGEAEDNQNEEFSMPNAALPEALRRPGDKKTESGLFGLYAAIANPSTDSLAPYKGMGEMFAIANVQDSGPSGATIGADTRVPQALNELWTRQPYQQRFAPLVSHADLTSTRVYGWKWATEPTVAQYAGNLAEVPSTAVDTEPVTADAIRVAGGNKIDRRFRDFNDQGVIASYLRLQTEAYARFIDTAVLNALIATGTPTTLGDTQTGIATGLTAIVDGALDIIATENKPAFAVVSPELWREIIIQPKDNTFEYLNAAFGLEEGSTGGFKILPGNVGAGNVLVGAKEALTLFELPGTPIRVQGLDVLHGGEDVAVFGYYATLVSNAAAVRLIDTAPAA